MDKKYIKLFSEIARTTEILAEKVMEFNHQKNDKDGEKTAMIMRDDFSKLYDKMRQENFSAETLTKAEYAKLLVGTMVVVNNIEDRIESEKKAVEGYKIDVIPKLQRIVNECQDQDSVNNLVKEIFKISEDK